MKYKKMFIGLVFSMIGSIYAQDNIINEIAKGGKFIVRDDEQNEAMVIENGNVEFNGTLKLGVLPEGDNNNSIVVWDPVDKLLKLQNRSMSAIQETNLVDENWHVLGYDGQPENIMPNISASVQSSSSPFLHVGDNYYSVAANSLNPGVYVYKYGTTAYGLKLQYTGYKFGTMMFGPKQANRFLSFGKVGSVLEDDNMIEYMRIDLDNGNVGIGTINPSAKLDVVGQVKITGGTPGLGKVLTSDATGLASWQTPVAGGGISLWTESGNNLYRTDGNVGIGTVNPSAKLDVVGQVKITGGTPGLGKVLTSDATGLASWQTPAAGIGSPLWAESGSNVYRADGNVGIGTTSPLLKLDVNGSAIIGNNALSSYLNVGDNYYSVAANSLNPGVYVFKNGATAYGMKLQYTGYEFGTMMFGSNQANRFLSFGKVGSALEDDNMIEYMRVDLDNGNVGIGTTNPSTKLDVNGTATAKRYVANGIHEITNSIWDLSQGNLAQITYSSGITPITINSDGSAGTYVLVVKKTTSCTDCNIYFSGADVKYPNGVNPTLSSGANTTDIFSFIAVGNNVFYCLYAKNLL